MARLSEYFEDNKKIWLEVSLAGMASNLVYTLAFLVSGGLSALIVTSLATLIFGLAIVIAIRQPKVASTHVALLTGLLELLALSFVASIISVHLLIWHLTIGLIALLGLPTRQAVGWGIASLVSFSGGYLLHQRAPLHFDIYSLLNWSVATLVCLIVVARLTNWRLGQVKQKAEKSNVLVQIVTHDIANPLTIVSGVCRSRLRNLSPDHAERKSWDRVNTAAQNMLQLLEEVKRLHAIQSGKISFDLQPVSLLEAIRTCEFTFENKLADKDLQLDIDYPADDDLWFAAEPISFSNEVLHNLISNAIKFSPRGGRISIAARREDHSIHVIVTDSGIGIPEKLKLILFDENKKTNRQGTEGEKGTGFGLPLLKHVIEAYGGRVEVESRPQEEHPDNHGTSFHLYLTACQSPPIPTGNGEQPKKPSLKIA